MIQYTIVGAIIALAIIWVLWKVLGKGNRQGGACSGCALSEACTKPRKKRSLKAPDCHSDNTD